MSPYRRQRGAYGEFKIETALVNLSFPYKVLTNIVLEDNGRETEIDILVLTSRGIFVIESKNFKGWIFGNEKQKMWTQTFSANNKNYFYNPIAQNANHIRVLQKYLNIRYGLTVANYNSLIVFGDDCELKAADVFSSNVWVITLKDCLSTMEMIYEESSEKLTAEQLDDMYGFLSRASNASQHK